jgi:hypothetical protein
VTTRYIMALAVRAATYGRLVYSIDPVCSSSFS